MTLVGFIVAMMSSAVAQTTETYRLKQEDILVISLYDEQQVNATVPVGIDGNVTAPFIGSIRAEGLTIKELEASLSKKYEEILRIRNPKVSVTIQRFRAIRASIVDMVNRPSVYDIRQGDRILDLLSYGGGPIIQGDKIGDLRRTTLRRKGSREVIPIDLYAMLRFGDMSQNYAIEDGDVLSIPEDKYSRINLIGQVQRQGTFPFREGMTLADAIAFGSGEVPYRGNLSKVVVSRMNPAKQGDFSRIVVDFGRYLKRGDSSQNIMLKPGDIIYVPESSGPDLNRLSTIVGAISNGLFILDRFGLGILPRR